jgi:hypothetical protein
MKIITSYREIAHALQVLYSGIRKSKHNIYAYDIEMRAADEKIMLKNPVNKMEAVVQGDIVEEGAIIVYYFLFRDMLASFRKGSLFIYTTDQELVFHSEYAKLSVNSEDIIRSDRVSYCYYKDYEGLIQEQDTIIKRYDLGKKLYKKIQEGDLITFRDEQNRLLENLPVVQKKWNSKHFEFPFILFVWDGEDVIAVPSWAVKYYRRPEIPWDVRQKYELYE